MIVSLSVAVRLAQLTESFDILTRSLKICDAITMKCLHVSS